MGTVIIKDEIDLSSKIALIALFVIFLWSLIRYFQENRIQNIETAKKFRNKSFRALGTILLFDLMYLLLIVFEKWVQATGVTTPIYLILQICTPLFWSMTGWIVIDTIFEIFNLQFIEKKWASCVGTLALIVVGAYILYLIPNVIYEVLHIIQNLPLAEEKNLLCDNIDAIRSWLNDFIGVNLIYKYLVQIFYIGNSWIELMFTVTGVAVRIGKRK